MSINIPTTTLTVTDEIHLVKVGDKNYSIASKYIWDGATTGSPKAYTWQDIKSLIDNVGLELVVDSAKSGSAEKEPATTAAATTLGKIYLVPDSDAIANGTYIEWLTLDKGASANPRYVWEQIGTTAVDIRGLQTSNNGGQTVNTNSAGEQTATVSGTVKYTKADANTGWATSSVSSATGSFSGTQATISATYKPAGSVSLSGVNAHTHATSQSVLTDALGSASLEEDTATTPTFAFNTDAIKSASLTGTTSFNTDAIKSAVLSSTTANTGIAVPVTLRTTADSAGAHTHDVDSHTHADNVSASKVTAYTAPSMTPITFTANTLQSLTTRNYGFSSSTSNVMSSPVVTDGVLSWTTSNASTQDALSTGSKASLTGGVFSAGTFTYSPVTAAGAPSDATLTAKSGGAHTHTLSGGSVGKMTVTVASAGKGTVGISTAAATKSGIKLTTSAATSKVTVAGAPTDKSASASFSGTQATISATYTPAGSVNVSVTMASHSHSIGGSSTNATVSLSAAVSSHTHSVTVASHTHDIIKTGE